MSFKILFLAALSCFAVSCSNVYSVKRYGVRATLIDSTSEAPISGANTVIVIDEEAFEHASDQYGEVLITPDLKYHVSWLGSPTFQYEPSVQIELSCKGYDRVIVDWSRYYPEGDHQAKESGGVIDLGQLRLIRSEAD